MANHSSDLPDGSAAREVDRLAAAYWDFLLAREPSLRTRRGLPVESLPGVSDAEADERAGFAAGVLNRLDTLRSAVPPGPSADTAEFLRALAEQEAEAGRFHWLTPTATPYQLFRLQQYGDTVFRPFRFEQRADTDRYVSLVRDLARCVATVGDKAAGQAARGFRIPAPALAGVHTTLTRLRASATRYVRADAERLTRLDAASRGHLHDAVAGLVAAELEPAFDRLLALVDDPDYLREAPETVGWAHYPEGEAAYRAFVRTYTSGDTPPERLHELGREHCRELSERMREMRATLGFAGTEAEFHERLATEPRLYAATPEEVEARYRGHLDRLTPLLPRWFTVLPDAPYGVARLDPALEASMTFGYYDPPTATQPVGRYRYNASDLAHRSLLGAAALIYHELAPGHHFHLARQAESTELPDLRRELVPFSGFQEGWAEYAAGLAWEMGLYDDPWDAYGRLAHERFTAQRLVVDTGLNLGTMTLEEARTFMRAHAAAESEEQIATELLRYATDMPGQALTYRAGHTEFTALRAAYERDSGAAFDVRAFHETVLAGGTLPFPALRRRVERELHGADGRPGFQGRPLYSNE
ncbi:DUF885 domain-containing protein [Streptomyces olivochromogenes]|uniref:DUF885 domain-containing protein n=1 Tax=Streptomyces olivochromogenes TaxID=1963 RepID=A0A250VVG2_STROL|nr:DUF885 domain-containing protein [Streptomyces olivochromogenes]KUN40818.1 hypothetical protein AQJ27_40915 [Streptomyces olivochromogenes]GAX58076.1 hypothetical protein SO3561_09647 [Streptomyces olivochromogenes]